MKRGAKFSYKFYILIAVLLGIISYQIWLRFHNQSGHNHDMVPAVNVITVTPQNLSITNQYSARISAVQETEIRPRITGILLKKLYKEGEFVKKDTPLFELDSAQLNEALKNAEATFNFAKHNFQRTEKLFQQKVVSNSEYDQALSNYQQAEASFRLAKINLEYAIIKAPIDGFVSNSLYSEGSLVKAGESLLTTIFNMNHCYVEFSYSDKDILGNYINDNKDKLQITLILDNGKIYPLQGKIDFIDSTIDKQTGTIKARGIIPNPDYKLKPGQFVNIALKGIEMTDKIVIPDRSIMQGPQGPFVYTVTEENKVAIKPVNLGPLLEQGRLIEKGLVAGDKIVTEGMIKIHPEQTVKIE